jgi:16S rRNA (adenine(1408)-N(1))-methyltransferase
MVEASRRAAGPARKGGLDNALFVLAAAEAPPAELWALAARVTVLFPWGSLL